MKSILVVDDMAIFREPIEAILRAEGCTVFSAANGSEALEMLSIHRPDLILLDLGMPIMDGLTALRKIREHKDWKRIAVIVLSAETDRSRIVDAVKLGIDGYLLKSQFSLKVMMERVTKTLETPIGSGEIAHRDAAGKPHSGSAGTTKPAAAATHPPKPSSPTPKRPTSRGTSPEIVRNTSEADLKSLRSLMTRSELLERINATSELTGFSPTVSQVLKITSSETCSMDQVANAVSQDHAIAIKVMKLANSAVYSRGDRVDTVYKAVLRIGMQNIRQAVLNIGVVERFASLAFEKHLSTPLFWEHSIACGIIATEIAHSLKHKEPDIAFTAGLLHDLGRVIYAERLGEQYVQVLEKAQEMQLPLEQVESRLLLMSHAEVMENLLHAWRFPKDLVNPIVFHHAAPGDVKSVAPHQAADVLRLGLADRLAHAMMLGSSGNDTIYPTEEHCRLLGVEAATIRRIEEAARQQTDDTKFALLSQSNGAAWPRRVEQYRAALTAPFRPLYVSEMPELDAYRIFCAELAGPSGHEPPNVAVVHVASAKERAAVSQRLVNAERDHGVQGIPALILSPGGLLLLDSTAMADRRCCALTTPTVVSQFIAAANELISIGAVLTAA